MIIIISLGPKHTSLTGPQSTLHGTFHRCTPALVSIFISVWEDGRSYSTRFKVAIDCFPMTSRGVIRFMETANNEYTASVRLLLRFVN